MKPEGLAAYTEGVDKVWAIRVSSDGSGLAFAGREFDVTTGRLGGLQRRAAPVLRDAPRELLRFAFELFSPYAEIWSTVPLLHYFLNSLLVSMDSPDEEITRSLRPGTSVPHITRNIEKFIKACPDTLVAFSIVVSSPTVSRWEASGDSKSKLP